ncbi:hypothetical protein C8F04DRAFT_1235325 [Mycena alexandri]|uniref:Uncharacterized protein n=1 Tax=Mycena alexandri TaxID=1745969 RepID=A0AAD6SR81_9AGAR|nr:hypothetical protein C8F04DRAFT_1235325 [Mycena alexandri]
MWGGGASGYVRLKTEGVKRCKPERTKLRVVVYSHVRQTRALEVPSMWSDCNAEEQARGRTRWLGIIIISRVTSLQLSSHVKSLFNLKPRRRELNAGKAAIENVIVGCTVEYNRMVTSLSSPGIRVDGVGRAEARCSGEKSAGLMSGEAPATISAGLKEKWESGHRRRQLTFSHQQNMDVLLDAGFRVEEEMHFLQASDVVD